MNRYVGALVASVALSQPAFAQEVAIRCTGESVMTIYNPHGNGGTAGGPSPKEWIIRTDGRTASLTIDGETGPARDVMLSVSGISFCAARADVPCDVVERVPYKDGSGSASRRVARYTVTEGVLNWDMQVIVDGTSMKTGVEVVESGTCDQDALEELRRLRESGAAFSSGGDDGDDRDRAGNSSDESRSDDQGRDSDSFDGPSTGDEDADARREREERERMEAEEKQSRADAQRRREEELDRIRREDEDRRAEEQRVADERQAEEQRKREAEAERRAEERRRKEEERNRLVDFREGIVLCEPRGGSSKEFRCEGPLQLSIGQVKTLDDSATRTNVGDACGSSRSLRDLGMVNGMRAFGCGFGIHPDANMADYPGNRDIAARFGVYISDRAVFRCKRSVSAYCRGQ